MANVLEILFQAKGVEETVGGVDRVRATTQALRSATTQAATGLGSVATASRATGAELDRLGKPRRVRVDGKEVDELRRKVRELEGALEPRKLGARIDALQRQLGGGGGGPLDVGRLASLQFSSLGKLTSGLLAASGAAFVATQAFQLLSNTTRTFLRHAAEGEEAGRRFAVALAATGNFSVRGVQEMRAYANALQNVTKESDEAILATSSLIAQLGGLSGDRLKQATQAALDLSAGLGIDLQSAALLVAKAAVGSTETLSRYGIVIDETVPKAQKFAAVLDLVQQKFGGSAVGQAQTFTGALTQMRAAFSDLAEAVGTPLLEPATRGIHLFTAAAQNLTRRIEGDLDPALQDVPGRLHVLTRAFEEARGALGGLTKSASQAAALQDFLKSAPVRALSLTVERGDVVQAEIAVKALEKSLADLSRTSKGVDVGPVRELARAAREQLTQRIVLDTARARADLEAFGQQFKPKTLRAAIAFDDAAFLRAVESLQPRVPALRVPVDERGLEGARRQFRAMQAEAEAAVSPLEAIRANLRLTIPQADIETLTAQRDALLQRFTRQTDLGTETARQEAQQTLELIREFQKLAAPRVDLIIETKGIEKLAELRRQMDELLRVSTGARIEVVGPDDLKRSQTLAQEMDRARKSLEALLAAGKGEAATESFNAMQRALDELGRAMPERAAQIEAFRAALERDFVVRMQVAVDTERAAAELRNLQGVARQFAGQLKLDNLELLSFQKAIDEARDLNQLLGVMRSLVGRGLELGSADALTRQLASLRDMLRESRQGLRELSSDAQTQLGALGQDLERAVEKLAPLNELAQREQRIAYLVELQRIDAAIAELSAYRAELDKIPKTLETEVRLKRIEKLISDAKRGSERVRSEFDGLKNAGFDFLTGALAAPLQAMLRDARNWRDEMLNIIRSLVDQIIREFTRLAILQAFRAIAQAASGVPGATGPQPTPGVPSGGILKPQTNPETPLSLPGAAAFRKPAELPELPVFKPRLVVQEPDPVTWSPALRVDLPAAVSLPGLAVFAEELPPVTLAAPRVSAQPFSALRLLAPTVGVEPLGAQVLAAPRTQVAALGDERLAPPSLAIGALPAQRLRAPAVTVPHLAGLDLLPPALAPVQLSPPPARVRPFERIELSPSLSLAPPRPLTVAPELGLGPAAPLHVRPAIDLVAPRPQRLAPQVEVLPPAVERLQVRAPELRPIELPPPLIAAPAAAEVSVSLGVPDLGVLALDRPSVRLPRLGELALEAPTVRVGPARPADLHAPEVRVAAPGEISLPGPSVRLARQAPPEAALIRVPEPVVQTPTLRQAELRVPEPLVHLPELRAAELRVPAPVVGLEPGPAATKAAQEREQRLRGVASPALSRFEAAAVQLVGAAAAARAEPPGLLAFARAQRPFNLGTALPTPIEARGRRRDEDLAAGPAPVESRTELPSVTINAQDTKDVLRSLRSGELGRALPRVFNARRI